MKLRLWPFAFVPALFFVGAANADFPLMNMVADKIIQRYQSSSCEQLAQKRPSPDEQEQRIVQLMKSDPALRTRF